MLFFFFFVMSMFFTGEPGNGPGALFAIVFPLHILTMLLMFVLTAIYIVNVFKNERVNKDMKVLWAVVIFMGNILAMPIYYYLYIWREPVSPSPPPAQLGAGRSNWWKGTKTTAAPEVEYIPPREPPDWR